MSGGSPLQAALRSPLEPPVLSGWGQIGGGAAVVETAFTLVSDDVQTAGLVSAGRSDYTLNGIRRVGAVSVIDGKQYVLGYDIDTCAVVAKHEVCSRYTAEKDDHNPAKSWKLFPDQDRTAFLSSGHDTFAEVAIRETPTGDPADFTAETVLVLPATCTYPTPLGLPAVNQPHFHYRGANQAWYFGRWNGSWQAYANPYWQDTEQCYVNAELIPGTSEYLCVAARNPVSGGTNLLWSFRVNVDTGAVRKADGTVIANFKTGAPAFSANPATADVFYTAPSDVAPSIGVAYANGLGRWVKMGDFDGQWDELWTAECLTPYDPDPANYTWQKILNAGFGVGSGRNTPWSQSPNHMEVFLPGISNTCLMVGQILGGQNYNFIIERQSVSSWKNILFINQAAQNTDHWEQPQWSGDVNGKLRGIISVEDHVDYDNITGAKMVAVRIDSVGAAAPVITSAATGSIAEFKHFRTELTADQPCGFNIVGGADADKFEIVGGKYLELLYAADFDDPHDADLDNQFDVQISARGINGLESATQNYTLNILSTTKTGGVEQFTSPTSIANVAWTKVGINNGSGAGQDNSPDVQDPTGGNTMWKGTQTATTTSHRFNQNKTAIANAKYTQNYIAHKDITLSEANYATIRQVFASGVSISSTFDLKRGRMVHPGVGTVQPTSYFCRPKANGNFHFGISYFAPSAPVSGEVGLAIRRFAGPNSSELGSTASSIYVKSPSYRAGEYTT